MTVDEIKKLAKRWRKVSGVTHSLALERIARDLGYKNWHTCVALKRREEYEKTKEIEQERK